MPTIFPIIRFNDADAGLAWLKDHPLPPAVRAFRDHALKTHEVQR